MKNSKESGHVKNVGHLQDLVSYCTLLGTDYNPARAAISITELNSLLVNSRTVIENIHLAIAGYRTAVIERENAFAPLSKICTRILNSLASMGASEHQLENVKALVRKIKGTHLKSKNEAATNMASPSMEENADTTNNPIHSHSTSQMSYDYRLDNFQKLISYLENMADYSPNEVELKVATLKTIISGIKPKNIPVVNAEAALSQCRMARNELFYGDVNGLVSRTLAVKAYVKSLYGGSSPQYKKVAGISFSKNNHH